MHEILIPMLTSTYFPMPFVHKIDSRKKCNFPRLLLNSKRKLRIRSELINGTNWSHMASMKHRQRIFWVAFDIFQLRGNWPVRQPEKGGFAHSDKILKLFLWKIRAHVVYVCFLYSFSKIWSQCQKNNTWKWTTKT